MESLRGFWETIKQIKHRGPQPKFCPKCRGSNIYPATTLGILPTTYKCRDCDYKGYLVIELENEEDE